MAGFGFGFGSHTNSNPRIVTIVPGSSLPVSVPSQQWTGVAGSGFATIPSDPARTSAKPMLRLLVPPNQYFTDELLVGVIAGANDGGSLYGNMGLRHVLVHYEGSTGTIIEPSLQTFPDANGTYRSYFGWWTILRHSGRSGHADIYFEAVPNNPAMQNRVIGPFQFSPQSQMHDGTISVAASGGADFQTVAEALSHCRANALHNPLVTIIEPGDYDIADGTQIHEGEGYCTITAALPSVRIARPGYTTDAAGVVRTRYNGLRFMGANLEIDARHILEFFIEPGAKRFHWMDGCTIINSGGPGALWRGVTRPAQSLVRDGGWFTECRVENGDEVFKLAKLVRGTTSINGQRDLYAGCPVVVSNSSQDHRSDMTLGSDVPAIELFYTGSAAAATVEIAEANGAASRTLVVKIAGSADRSFTLHKSEAAYHAGTNYTLQNLVDWLNTIPAVTATLLDPSNVRAAAWLSLPGLRGGAFGPGDFKAESVMLVTNVDVQGAWWSEAGLDENVVLWGNTATGLVAPVLNFASSGAKRDILLANNAVQNDSSALRSATLASRFAGASSHVICVHNTLSTQSMIFNTSEAYSSGSFDLVANNSVRAISWTGPAGTTPIINNHVHGGTAAPASASGLTNVTGTTIGGDARVLYVNDQEGDFRARGPLASNLAPPVLRFSASGEMFDTLDTKGAAKIAPEQSIVTADSVTQYGITFHFSEARPIKRYPTGDWRVLGPVTITAMSPDSQQVSGNYLQSGTFSSAWVHGAQVNPGNRVLAPGGLSKNNKDNQAQGLNGIRSVTNYAGTAYAHGKNVDPGAIGQPLTVATGSVMKFVSNADTPWPQPSRAVRPGGADMAVLSVVDDLASDDALRPGVAQADMTHHFTEADWDLSVFNNFPQTPSAPSAAQAIANVQRAFALQFTDSVNSENAHAGNNHPSYGREIGQLVHTTALALHLDYAPQDKIDMLNGLYGIAIDAAERINEGGECIVPAGGGNGWKKAALVIVTAALRNAAATAKLANLRAISDAQQNFVFADDKQIREITPQVIAAPRATYDNRNRDPYQQWMEGSLDFAEGARPSGDEVGSGPNWRAPYRGTFTHSAFGGILAVLLTKGAKSLWNRPELFEYYRTHWATTIRRGEVQPGDANDMILFFHDMAAAHWPADPVAPQVEYAGALGDGGSGKTTLWLRFDKAIDETSAVPLGNFTIKVNGQPVSGITRPPYVFGTVTEGVDYAPNAIFRRNLGLVLPVAINSSDIVTISYAGGAGSTKLRSEVDKINVAAFTDLPVTNRTASVSGLNASYPVVRFTGSTPDRYQTIGAQALGADSPRVTLWLPHLKLLSAPSATVELFGAAGGAPTFELQLLSDRRLLILLRDSAGNFIFRTYTASSLALNTAYAILIDGDVTDSSAASGRSLVVNGTPSNGTTPTWAGGTGKAIGWSRPATYSLGSTSNSGFDGEFGGLWLNTAERVTDPAQRARFTSLTNGSLDIGTLGDGITGTQPQLFLVGNATQINDPAGFNRGSGPKFFRQNGGAVDTGMGTTATWQ